MLFSSLYRALFAMVDRELAESEAETTVKAIKDGLNTVLESSTDFCAPFIGSLHVRKALYGAYFLCLNRTCVSMRNNLSWSQQQCQQLAFIACSNQSVSLDTDTCLYCV